LELGVPVGALNSKQQKIVRDLFEDPIRANIDWSDVESLLKTLGKVTEGSGSRVRALVNGKVAIFHRSHPEKETDKGTVKSVRRFLREAGVKP
jgi:hypothetical protein